MKRKMIDEGVRRWNLLLWAYAYEVLDDPLVDDYTFDSECNKVDLSINCALNDSWWKKHFNPSTGQWVHLWPNQSELAEGVKWAR